MQSATASDSASAFRSTSSITPWIGRIDPADLWRSAGLLCAALSQCAHERGLSLSEMAQRPLSRTEILRRALDRAATDALAPSPAAPASGTRSGSAPNIDGAAGASVLGLKPGSPWPTVERVRRSLLQQYHPDRLGHVSPRVQKLAESDFGRVGEAYDLLKAQR
jgi:hypothetical protein